MVRGGLTTGGIRALAVMLALALSGRAPLPEARAHEGGEHRCQCRHAPGEVCSCPGCRRAAAAERRARLAELPPCHRAAAEAALEAEERPAPPGGASATGCCGTPEQHRATLLSGESFLLPDVTEIRPPAPCRGAPVPALPPAERACVPPTPPPRAG